MFPQTCILEITIIILLFLQIVVFLWVFSLSKLDSLKQVSALLALFIFYIIHTGGDLKVNNFFRGLCYLCGCLVEGPFEARQEWRDPCCRSVETRGRQIIPYPSYWTQNESKKRPVLLLTNFNGVQMYLHWERATIPWSVTTFTTPSIEMSIKQKKTSSW